MQSRRPPVATVALARRHANLLLHTLRERDATEAVVTPPLIHRRTCPRRSTPICLRVKTELGTPTLALSR